MNNVPSDDAAIFDINPDQDSDYSDTEDPAFPLPGGHRRIKRPDPGDKPMNDPFPPMFLAKAWKKTGGRITASGEPDDGVLWTRGAHQAETGFGTK